MGVGMFTVSLVPFAVRATGSTLDEEGPEEALDDKDKVEREHDDAQVSCHLPPR